ncbi:uncharacterized protein AMSG_06326 [Thecamonas trahens ATCC 50062]|uniref:Uncharacterized protein n=1 Tax=Thecamonas trahens ATCC 50062 TaxID=461836 RepID=A0A0L0DCX3_THETB|nr:hypothetical protein AMSG_06326 [Thecamonas trahens ATCC 50062]KNC50184.1 hypothetical protein AMSG_06326 [Thecamonas trahens ATCC 50062]|eukprot:XP_013757021.1 hypothetical protein AMSG_06326 [Thecamonas trahens ATCC 50062]
MDSAVAQHVVGLRIDPTTPTPTTPTTPTPTTPTTPATPSSSMSAMSRACSGLRRSPSRTAPRTTLGSLRRAQTASEAELRPVVWGETPGSPLASRLAPSPRASALPVRKSDDRCDHSPARPPRLSASPMPAWVRNGVSPLKQAAMELLGEQAEMLAAADERLHTLRAAYQAEKDDVLDVAHLLDTHPPRSAAAFGSGSPASLSIEALSCDSRLQAALVASPVEGMDAASGTPHAHRLRRELPASLASPRSPLGLSSRCSSWCLGVAPRLPPPPTRSPVADLLANAAADREHTENRLIYLKRREMHGR